MSTSIKSSIPTSEVVSELVFNKPHRVYGVRVPKNNTERTVYYYLYRKNRLHPMLVYNSSNILGLVEIKLANIL